MCSIELIFLHTQNGARTNTDPRPVHKLNVHMPTLTGGDGVTHANGGSFVDGLRVPFMLQFTHANSQRDRTNGDGLHGVCALSGNPHVLRPHPHSS